MKAKYRLKQDPASRRWWVLKRVLDDHLRPVWVLWQDHPNRQAALLGLQQLQETLYDH